MYKRKISAEDKIYAVNLYLDGTGISQMKLRRYIQSLLIKDTAE